MKAFVFSFLFVQFFFVTAQEQNKFSAKEYIEMYKNIATNETHKHHIPISIILAQGLLESGYGKSDIAINANNHFGIKCGSSWKGDTYYADDDHKNECFRKYKNADESYNDHSVFLSQNQRYAFLFKLSITDYKGWAKGLKEAGYATNTKYAEALIKIIEDNKLYEYDSEIRTKHKIKSTTDFGIPCHLCNRKLFVNNKVPFIIVDSSDTPAIIAKEFDMRKWQIYKYNDISKNDSINKGDTIYLKPKKRKAIVKNHIVKSGETVHSISQMYAIKEKHIYKKNQIVPGTQIQPEQKLWLRKNKPVNVKK